MTVNSGGMYSSFDLLTGLGSRDSFFRTFSKLVADSCIEPGVFSLIVIDIDHFKSVNDGFGHRRGDQILAEFGKRVSEVSREKDMLFRYGGDEFTGILPGADLDEARRFASRLLEKISETEFDGAPPLFISISIGVAQFPLDGQLVRELFDVADRRLFSAKRTGRNRVVSVDDPGQLNNSYNPYGRLLGRGKELAVFRSFTEEAADKGRGFFLVMGPDGSGKSYFLGAAASFLSLGDYKLLELSGTGKGRQAPHSVIASALGCSPESDAVTDALHSYSGVSMCVGVILKDMHLIDSSSIDDVLQFYAIYPGWVIVAGSTERNILSQSSKFGGVSVSVRLGSLSLEDCRAWFRAILMWDPPEFFLEWFHSETKGLPGFFAQGVRHLERRGFLHRDHGDCSVDEGFMNFPLGSRLEFGTTAEINNLPVNLSPFIGRSGELTRIGNLLNSGVRLITLKGMNGMGGRRLAIRAAVQNEFMFSSGVCLVDGESGSTSVPDRLAAELSLRSGRNTKKTIENFLADTKMLLVFVNVSSGDEIVSYISSLLTGCTDLVILVTARVSLNVPGEEVVDVNGVSTVKPSADMPSEAAGIFIQAAERLAGVRFSGDMDLNVVEEICSLVNGAPLAIELAASWIRVMSVSSICRRIRANPSFLGGTEKEKTTEGLSDLFQHSWEQLSTVEKTAVTRLTVFAGHFTVEEAEEVSDVSPEMILSLVNRSFLLRDDQGIHIPAMTLDFIVQEKKTHSRGFQVAREMHCRFFAASAQTFGEMARTGREAGRGLDAIKTSFSDIAYAWKTAIEKGRHRFLRQMMIPVTVYCQDRGRFRTGFNMLREAISCTTLAIPDGLKAVIMANQSLFAFRMGRTGSASGIIAESLDITEGMSGSDRATVLFIRGKIMVEQGSLSEAGDYLNKALEIFISESQHIEALEVELLLIKYNLLCGNYALVRRTLPAVSRRCIEYSFRTGEWQIKLFTGKLAEAEGDFRKAREAFLGYMSAVKTAGYTDLCAVALNEVAGIEAKQGRLGEAEQHYLKAAEYYKRIGSVRGQAGIKLNLASMGLRSPSGPELRKNYAEALSLGEKAHDENIIARSLEGLAQCSVESGETEKANSFLRRAAVISCRSGNRPILIRALCGLASLDYRDSNPVLAAITVLALVNNPASDSDAREMCRVLLDKLRATIGEEKIEDLNQDIDSVTLQELLDMHTVTDHGEDDGAYRNL